MERSLTLVLAALAAASSLVGGCAGAARGADEARPSSAPAAPGERRPPPPDPAMAVVAIRANDGTTLGAAFVVDASGHLLTTRAIAASAGRTVQLGDGSVRTSSVVGTDTLSELAVLKLHGPAPAALPLADVPAVLGDDAIPLDAPIDGGGVFCGAASVPAASAGCPIVDARGDVVGIALEPTRGVARTRQVEVVRRLLPRLVAARGQDVPRTWMGLVPRPSPKGLLRWNGTVIPRGVVVESVLPDGPATTAGLAPGDIIVAFDGMRVVGDATLEWFLHVAGPGHRATLYVLHDNVPAYYEVTLEEQPRAL